MYRVFCKLGSCRYYWTKSGIWSMRTWAAQPLRQHEALQIAETEEGQIEPM